MQQPRFSGCASESGRVLVREPQLVRCRRHAVPRDAVPPLAREAMLDVRGLHRAEPQPELGDPVRRPGPRLEHAHGPQRLHPVGELSVHAGQHLPSGPPGGPVTRSYVEGATSACSASGNAAKHIPALYFFGSYTDTPVAQRPRLLHGRGSALLGVQPERLPDFAFVTPTLCNDGHDCGNSTVDTGPTNVQPVLNWRRTRPARSRSSSGTTRPPVPNMQIGLHAAAGVKATPINYCSTLHRVGSPPRSPPRRVRRLPRPICGHWRTLPIDSRRTMTRLARCWPLVCSVRACGSRELDGGERRSVDVRMGSSHEGVRRMRPNPPDTPAARQLP